MIPDNVWHRQPVTISGLDHFTDVDGECVKGCAACEIERLREENRELRDLIARIVSDVNEDVERRREEK